MLSLRPVTPNLVFPLFDRSWQTEVVSGRCLRGMGAATLCLVVGERGRWWGTRAAAPYAPSKTLLAGSIFQRA